METERRRSAESKMHLTRYSMYRQIASALPRPLAGRILGISGIENFYSIIDRARSELVETSFPQVDMQSLPFPDEHFDVVISDQVLAHLPDARRAVKEAFRVLKVGGTGIHTTTLLNPILPYPNDYSRFSCEGLKTICPDGVEVLQCASWGNRIAFGLILLHNSFFRFLEVPERPGVRRWLATYNDPNYPIHTWIVGRKLPLQ
jgi:SAM-dependent methyltransferase